jgi:hypothetical protein
LKFLSFHFSFFSFLDYVVGLYNEKKGGKKSRRRRRGR